MGKLIIDGNKVYMVDEACMRRKNLTLSQILQKQADKQKQQQREETKQ